MDPSALAAECQRKYACSTSVNDLPGKNSAGQEVILQVRSVESLCLKSEVLLPRGGNKLCQKNPTST
jgi:hypothetical protein